MTRSERIKMRSRMQRRIRLVVEERRMALSEPHAVGELIDPDDTIEIPQVAIGRVRVESM